jgi:GNAT superfamily N-acetyltransferase
MLLAFVSLCGTVAWIVRELAPEETHDLRRRVSADGRTDIPTFDHPLDEATGAWHLGATDASGRVVAISSYFRGPCSWRPGVEPAVQLQFMAVEPSLQRQGAGSAILAEAIRRLRSTDAALLWAHARDNAIPFYERFGFAVVEGSRDPGPETGRPHHIIVLELLSAGGR